MPKSVYIHIPFCKSKCLYCGFYSKPPNQYDVKKVLNAEIAELKKSSFSKPAQTLYIGGGSPASVGIDSLCEFLSKVVELTGKADEFTVEINPADADENLLVNLKNIGVNRISIGAQSFIQSELDFLGRKYSVEKIDQTIKNAKQAGFNNIGLDLIFAVPGSNLSNWRQTLKKAIQADVQHISAYSLSYEKNTPLEKTKSAGKVKAVDEELDRKMYETVIKELAKAGFEHYEISNFAKPGFKCRHNLTYWKNEYYLGIGPAAASYIGDWRIENISDIEKYVEYIEQNENAAAEKIKISPLEKASQTAVLNLRLIEGIDLKEYQQKTDLDIYKFFGKSIEKNLNLKLLQLKDNRLSLTKQAMPIADSVLCDFAQPD
ncbi:MAG: radical SAM family heme chaperone HemW [Phycisphaerae bacterium]|nr:radical SAM family heme chaperone HemW [Phycisphaerae bacterium]